MKKVLSRGCVGMLICMLGFTSCMNDFDTPVTGNAFGNNSIKPERTISIANLKEKYDGFIDTTTDTYTAIEGTTRIEGVIVGDDESGNIYKQLVVADETGAIIVKINNTGLYAACPVGQKVVIDCEGLQIGSYRRLAEIGSVYEGKVGNLPEYEWKKRVRIINKPQMFYEELKPLEISTAAELAAIDMKRAPLLVTLKNVTFPEADGTVAYAPEKDIASPTLKFVERKINFEDGTECKAVAHTSIYANFSKDALPQGNVNVTGILTRYNTSWQLLIRTSDDVKRNN